MRFGSGTVPLTRGVAAVSAYVVTGLLVGIGVSACSNASVGDQIGPLEVRAVAPMGATSSLEFRWEFEITASRYRLVIRDAGGTVVFSGESPGRSMNIDETARSRFATMVDYSWTVAALNSDGSVIAESKPSTFTYQP